MHYHVSRSAHTITEFRPFTHFGVAQAALERSRSAAFSRAGAVTPVVYEVELLLDPAFALRVPDLTSADRQNTHGLYTFTDALHYDLGVISGEDRDRVFTAASSATADSQEAAGFAELALVIGRLGYQGLVYANQFEAKGQDSFMILGPQQVRIARTITLDELSELSVDLAAARHPTISTNRSLRFR